MNMLSRASRSSHLLAPALAALLLAGSPLAFASTEHAGHGAMHAPAANALTEGIVKKLDKAAGRVTIAHGPLPNGMPAMTMPFALADASWFGKLREGQKIRFRMEDVKGVLTVLHLELVK